MLYWIFPLVAFIFVMLPVFLLIVIVNDLKFVNFSLGFAVMTYAFLAVETNSLALGLAAEAECLGISANKVRDKMSVNNSFFFILVSSLRLILVL